MNGFCMAVVCVALNSGAANKTTRKSCKEQTSRKIKKTMLPEIIYIISSFCDAETVD